MQDVSVEMCTKNMGISGTEHHEKETETTCQGREQEVLGALSGWDVTGQTPVLNLCACATLWQSTKATLWQPARAALWQPARAYHAYHMRVGIIHVCLCSKA